MKTKEELNALKEKVETVNKKPAELNEEELELVNGGLDENSTMYNLDWMLMDVLYRLDHVHHSDRDLGEKLHVCESATEDVIRDLKNGNVGGAVQTIENALAVLGAGYGDIVVYIQKFKEILAFLQEERLFAF